MVLTLYVLDKIPQSINMSALFNIALYQIESACLVEYAQGIIWLMSKYHKWIVRLNGMYIKQFILSGFWDIELS